MSLFRRSKHAARATRKPTWRERRAAERTARAEASLIETEQKIHQIADEARNDLKGPALLPAYLLRPLARGGRAAQSRACRSRNS
ncbi:MAG TPA: hypothetical protein VMK84_30595 [Streptosporangiaceae bacterium]|nr:hypothetical protein [Streptosporangiaceae bacterium]